MILSLPIRIPVQAAMGVVLLVLAGCDDGAAARAEAFWRARQARLDPPQLWSVEVIHEAHPGHPVRLCADSRLRTGFLRPNPGMGDKACARIGDDRSLPHGMVFKCALNEETYEVRTHLAGDLNRDFTNDFSIEPTDGGTGYVREMRFRRLGSCPAGWNVGDSTNQRGEHVHENPLPS